LVSGKLVKYTLKLVDTEKSNTLLCIWIAEDIVFLEASIRIFLIINECDKLAYVR
jgi:hypothetical protein